MTRIFKPLKKEVWTKLAREMDGNYVDGNATENDILYLPYKEWTFVIDIKRISEYRETRIRIPFLHKEKIKFTIATKSYLGKLLGINGILIGHEFFEKEFILKSSNEDQMKKLMKSQELIRLFEARPYLKLKTTTGKNDLFGLSYPPEISILHLTYPHEVLEIAVLRDLVKLLSILLDKLVEIDVAYSENPNFAL